MATKYVPLNAFAEIDTVARTVAVLMTLPAAQGEGDVVLFRHEVDITGPANADLRRKLRSVLPAD